MPPTLISHFSVALATMRIYFIRCLFTVCVPYWKGKDPDLFVTRSPKACNDT